MSIGLAYFMQPVTSAQSVRREITMWRGRYKEVYECFARNKSRLFDELNAGLGGRAGWNVYQTNDGRRRRRVGGIAAGAALPIQG